MVQTRCLSIQSPPSAYILPHGRVLLELTATAEAFIFPKMADATGGKFLMATVMFTMLLSIQMTPTPSMPRVLNRRRGARRTEESIGRGFRASISNGHTE